MKDTLITLENAKLAKKRGFIWETRHFFMPYGYDKKYESHYATLPHNHIEIDKRYINRPTQSLLQKWLRDNYNIHILPVTYKELIGKKYDCLIIQDYNKEYITEFSCMDRKTGWFNTYEEALEKGLQEALKLI